MPWQDMVVALVVVLALASVVRHFAPRRRARGHRDRPDVPVSRLIRRGRRQGGGGGRGCCGDNKPRPSP